MSGILNAAYTASSLLIKSPLCAAAEKAATALLHSISNGCLVIHTPSRTYRFGQHNPNDPLKAPTAQLTVHNAVFWLRLCAIGDLGFAEAYMYGEIDCEDLVNVFLVFLANRDQLSAIDSSLFSRLLSRMPHLGLTAHIVNTLANARKNISAHYDISNNMFMGQSPPSSSSLLVSYVCVASMLIFERTVALPGFLSRDMTYSCAIFPDLDGDLQSPSLQSSPRASTPSLTGSSTPSTLAGSEDPPKGFALDALHLFSASERTDRQADVDPASDPLEAAQYRKLRHIIRKADIRPGHRVLEIGSGWGALAILITSTIPHTTVDTLTLSTQQAELARARAAAAGVADRVHVHLMDYRSMPREWEGAFDRLVSVEMVEAVGREYMETYWAKIDWALNKETGVGVVQGITIPEARESVASRLLMTVPDEHRCQASSSTLAKWTLSGNGYVARTPPSNAHPDASLPTSADLPFHRVSARPAPYGRPDAVHTLTHRAASVFPGGFLPTLTFLVDTLARGSQGRLVVDAVENIGPHYARTLREWRRRFEARFEDVIVPALRAEYPGVMGLDDGKARAEIEVFRRKWIYYYCYCEVGFTTRRLGDHIITFTREGNVEYGCQVYE
ncbi:hypothetical protein BN946_scf184884.g6 [Trametes cinnabarina]|uniref:Cyclopropane-fatty-acyl-phospholipid synthase n=1 Tax=Pycnoporus cinnabarinus TaxID=5643 RepID=A0A060S5X3_PYCCI|nr:hypothetical protein BN946_scf184884.g6 [Trametes cinnabarina]